jgi:hypothetical protein
MNQGGLRTRRLACDRCHRGKTKCSRGTPCTLCDEGGRPCTYSVTSRLGRPKGSKNKRTLETRQVQERGNRGYKISSQGLSSDIQDSNELEQGPNQHQLGNPRPIFERTRDDSSKMTSIRIQDDTGLAASLLNAEASSSDTRASQIHNGKLPTPQLRSRTDDTSFEDLYGNLDCLMSNPTAFNNYPATGLATSSTARGFTFGTSQFSSSLTPHSSNCLDDVSLSSPDALDSPGITTCGCLDKQVKLLFRMDKVEQAQKQSSPDVALEAARDAIKQWDSLRQCTTCNKGGTEGVFLVFAMCMRFLLRALRCSFANTAMAEMADQQHSSGEDFATICRSNWRVSVGKYEGTWEEYKITSRMLIILAVRRIEIALAYTKTRLQQRQTAACLEPEGDKGSAEAVAIFDRLIQEEKGALLTENEFDSYMGMLLYGLEGILGSS